MSPCFDEGRCRCNNITADCSSNNGSLTYVPRLPIDVQVFNFSSNNLSHIPDGFFSNVSQVWLLDLCQNGLTSLSPRAFQELQNLTTLFLNGNSLIYKALTPVFHIRSLTNLQILCNNLSPMDLETFSNNSLGALTLLNVSLNNIGSLYMKSLEPLKGLRYFIAQQNKLYNLTSSACLLGQAAASFTIAVIIIVLVVFIISIVFFRYRWHLRLVMYEWFHHRSSQEQLRHFTNDVFVSYSEEDRKWVMQELLPVVEGEWNLRACVHERDFIPGKHIVDNIADCVQDSRKILMVFSPDYARSEWCQFELKYCQCCVMDRDEVLVLVLLHETESRDMTSAMFAVMKTTTYIEWASTVDAANSFWGRLSLALDCVISS
ncbi:hypothetical protein C0Q70_01774 [Pomacea canaliculata]|uniref:TIR domain-containing protein n=1 Tax=Pomacea canaliculata TaxID=400727 RepID=A0A2T7Q0E1_POMCA|nr:hypothetical protein C0Q70_01774 [Pomacea canaliculata]